MPLSTSNGRPAPQSPEAGDGSSFVSLPLGRDVNNCGDRYNDQVDEALVTSPEQIHLTKIEATTPKMMKPSEISKAANQSIFGYYASAALQYADAAGERLAYMLGITSPKYHREIEEYQRIRKAEEDSIKKERAEYAGWGGSPTELSSVIKNDYARTNQYDPGKGSPFDYPK